MRCALHWTAAAILTFVVSFAFGTLLVQLFTDWAGLALGVE